MILIVFLCFEKETKNESLKQEIILLKGENGSLKRENSFFFTEQAHFKEKQDIEIKLRTLAPVSNGPHLSNNANKFGPKRNCIFPPKSCDSK